MPQGALCVAANVAAVAPGQQQGSHQQIMPFPRAASQPLGLQSSDNIHIQLEPLHSMDSYAGKLMSAGMEVAIYSGRCPLVALAAYQPPPALQQQVCALLL